MGQEPTVYLGSLLEHGLFLLVSIALPLLAIIAIGAIVAGLFRVATQIDDLSIGFFGRVCAAIIFLYFASNYYTSRIVEYSTRVWGGSDYYF